MEADELRRRLKALGYSQRVAAEKLGLSVDGLCKQLYRVTKVSRQTAVIVEYLERLERPDIVRHRRQAEMTQGLREMLGMSDRQSPEPSVTPDRQLREAPAAPVPPPNRQPHKPPAISMAPPNRQPMPTLADVAANPELALRPAALGGSAARLLALRKIPMKSTRRRSRGA